jgi:thymidylate synthase
MKDLNGEYVRLIAAIEADGEDQLNERTGHMVRALPAQQLSINMSMAGSDLMLIPGWRKVFPKSALAETLWMLQGTTDPAWINKYTEIWKLWIEEDGSLPTAYGYRWRHAFDRDQFGLALDALVKDSSSRQVNVFAWHPGKDGNGMPNQPKNIPCVMGFTVNIINGALNMSVYLRSSDVIVGLPYDYMAYAFLMHFMCNTLKVRPGRLCLTLAHAHYYHCHKNVVANTLAASHTANWISGILLEADVAEALTYPDALMELDMKQAFNNPYNPRPELVL